MKLGPKYVKIGWSEDVYDLCWMACPGEGYLRQVGDHEICLCARHIAELESTAETNGYSNCDPPKTGGVYVIWERDEKTNMVTDSGMWWPWELVQRETA